MDHLGLSGLLFYEIRAPIPEMDNDLFAPREGTTSLSLEDVFGDQDDPTDGGMSVDDLLDVIHAKVVFFPAYACTSFIVSAILKGCYYKTFTHD